MMFALLVAIAFLIGVTALGVVAVTAAGRYAEQAAYDEEE